MKGNPSLHDEKAHHSGVWVDGNFDCQRERTLYRFSKRSEGHGIRFLSRHLNAVFWCPLGAAARQG